MFTANMLQGFDTPEMRRGGVEIAAGPPGLVLYEGANALNQRFQFADMLNSVFGGGEPQAELDRMGQFREQLSGASDEQLMRINQKYKGNAAVQEEITRERQRRRLGR